MNVSLSYIKNIIPLVLMILTAANSIAQNVGFGTNNPTEKLEINGNIKFRDTGKIIGVNDLHRILFRRNEQLLELREQGDIILSSNAVAGNETATMVIKNTGNVGIGTKAPDAAAILDLSSTTKGFLPPGMTYAQRQSIANPVAGLTVWCNNCDSAGELQVYNGTQWTNSVGGTAQVYIPNRVYVGQSYQGGTIFYLLKEGDSGYDLYVQHGLIAAPSNIVISQGGNWAYSPNETNLRAGSLTAIGTGNANSILITNNSSQPYPIPAGTCLDLSVNGYSDWYLPSRDELNQLYINRAVVSGLGTGIYFSSSYYVSTGSTIVTGNCWAQNFSNGSKVTINYVKQNQRAIRSF